MKLTRDGSGWQTAVECEWCRRKCEDAVKILRLKYSGEILQQLLPWRSEYLHRTEEELSPDPFRPWVAW